MTRPGAGAVAGVSADKIRFYAAAYAVATPADLVPVMTSESYAGDRLFILPLDSTRGTPGEEAAPARVQPWMQGQPLSADDTRRLSYEVLRFDANTLAIRVANPDASAGWLSYADVWHPSWRATVNGKRVPVYRANMAYKAIPIEGGDNVIEFRFGSRLFSVLAALASLNAAAWLIGLLLFVTRPSL
jgi:hypothetical protein